MSNLVTLNQAVALRDLGFKESTIRYAHRFNDKYWLQGEGITIKSNSPNYPWTLAVPTVDQAIDWIRRKYHVVVYDRVEPFVDPVDGRIKYVYAVKYCNVKRGWNFREYILDRVESANAHAAKRIAISAAIRHIKKKKDAKLRRRSKTGRK
jgi:hypothetical protein